MIRQRERKEVSELASHFVMERDYSFFICNGCRSTTQTTTHMIVKLQLLLFLIEGSPAADITYCAFKKPRHEGLTGLSSVSRCETDSGDKPLCALVLSVWTLNILHFYCIKLSVCQKGLPNHHCLESGLYKIKHEILSFCTLHSKDKGLQTAIKACTQHIQKLWNSSFVSLLEKN